ncbi:MAG: hypothetical protein KAW84_00325 [Thermoplasmata archaeon]|nr:hypothetical protein [Thermoplasmata archaeon]
MNLLAKTLSREGRQLSRDNANQNWTTPGIRSEETYVGTSREIEENVMYPFGLRGVPVEDESYESVLGCHTDFEEVLVVRRMLEITDDLLPAFEGRPF